MPRRPPLARIVKVRRLADPDAAWAVTDRTGSLARFIAPDQVSATVKRAMGPKTIVYFYVIVDDTNRLIFGAQAAPQIW
jgi:hypothetical protein